MCQTHLSLYKCWLIGFLHESERHLMSSVLYTGRREDVLGEGVKSLVRQMEARTSTVCLWMQEVWLGRSFTFCLKSWDKIASAHSLPRCQPQLGLTVAGAWSSIRVSGVDGRNPRTWVLTCSLAGGASAGIRTQKWSWNFIQALWSTMWGSLEFSHPLHWMFTPRTPVLFCFRFILFI